MRTLAELPGLRRPDVGSARAAGRPAGAHGRRAEALAHYEAVSQGSRRQRSRGCRAPLRKIGGLHWEAGERERASACFAAGLERLGEDGDPIERAQLFQEMGRLAFRAGDKRRDRAGPSGRWPRRRGRSAAADRERAREAAATRAQACNTLGVALARLGRLAEAVGRSSRASRSPRAHDLLQAACRGYTNLGVLYSTLDPRRSIETCLRGLETAKKVGDLGFQSRLMPTWRWPIAR